MNRAHLIAFGWVFAAVLFVAAFSLQEQWLPAGLSNSGSNSVITEPGQADSHPIPTNLTGAEEGRHFVTGLEGLPRSLEGTEVDGTLEAGADGHLKITADVRNVFEYFLTLQGEESLDTVVARMHAYFANQLPPEAAAEARALLAAYLDYKRALADIDAPTVMNGHIDVEAVRTRFAEAKAIRSRFLSAEAADAFYAADDAMDQYSLARHEILQRNDLAAGEQAKQLAALENMLPPTLQDSVRVTGQYFALRQLSEDWQTRNGTPAELRQIRENLLGAAAADRLEALDAERAEWDARINRWLEERASLLASAAMTEADRGGMVAQLRAQRFASGERTRVEVLERLHDQGS